MRESPFMKHLQLALGGRREVRCFRNTVGLAWHGEPVRLRNGDVLLKNARPVHVGLGPDTPDLVGWVSVEVTPAMVGQRLAVFMGAEVKASGGKVTTGQRGFLQTLARFGGIAMILRQSRDGERIEETIF